MQMVSKKEQLCLFCHQHAFHTNACNLDYNKICPDLLSHKTWRVQIYSGKTVQTVLLSEILFILFTLHLFTK